VKMMVKIINMMMVIVTMLMIVMMMVIMIVMMMVIMIVMMMVIMMMIACYMRHLQQPYKLFLFLPLSLICSENTLRSLCLLLRILFIEFISNLY